MGRRARRRRLRRGEPGTAEEPEEEDERTQGSHTRIVGGPLPSEQQRGSLAISSPEMPPLAAVLLAWSAIATYASLFHGALYVYRRDRARDHLAYALLCATHVGYSYGLSLSLRAHDEASARAAFELELGSGLLMAAAFYQFAMGRPSRATAASWVSMALGALLCALHLCFTPTGHVSYQPAGLGLDAARIALTPNALGAVFAFGSLAWSMLGLVTLFRRARDGTEARVVASVALPSIALSCWQVALRVGGDSVPWLCELTSIPIAVASGLVLLRRFARSATDLSAQSLALEASYEQLRRTQDALVQKQQLAAVGELSAVIAHEVRNPLAILKNAGSGLRQRALGAEDRRVLLGIVNEETDRLARLVRDLLAYARPLSPVRAPTKLRELAERACSDARLARARGETTIDIRVEPRLAVMVDREHAHYAIVNVIDNALVAMGGRGTLRIEARPARLASHAPGLALELTDDGPGMDPQVLGKARDPFFTTRPSGTGLGLAIVDRVMRGHEGRLELTSEPGHGTTVALVFPAWEPREPSQPVVLAEARS